tara:strand:- start:10246 stop:10653 length:408 start_codon:yes stop_codon:yes gene_type:complete
MIKELTKLANHLDSKGLRKEADYLDAVIRKIAAEPEKCAPGEEYNFETKEGKACRVVSYQVREGDSWWSITNDYSPGRTMKENAALNGMTTDDIIHQCQMLQIWSTPAYEGGANNPNCYDRPPPVTRGPMGHGGN